MISGQVWDVLPHGLRMRRLFSDEFYVIPAARIPPALQRLSLDPFSPRGSQPILVKFQPQEPGRAAALQPLSADVGGFPPALPPCPVMAIAANDWQIVSKSIVNLKNHIGRLSLATEQAQMAGDGDQICDIFCACIAGVQVLTDRHAWEAHFQRQLPVSELPCAGDISGLLNRCLASLWDMDLKIVRSKIQLALAYCRDLSPFLHWPALAEAWAGVLRFCTFTSGASRLGRKRKMRDGTGHGSRKSGERRRLLSPKLCNVDGCARRKVAKVYSSDTHGLAGHRCCVHGARSCSVPGCSNLSVRGSRSSKPRRCWLHCDISESLSEMCSIPGCERIGKGRREADAYGPAGRRCVVHGCGCRVFGCRRQAWGLSKADVLGPAGPACWLHGGNVCSVPGCASKPKQRLQSADGFLCSKHSLPQSKRAKEKAFSPDQCKCTGGGWRCKRQRKEMSKYCAHHDDLYKKRLQRLKDTSSGARSAAKDLSALTKNDTALEGSVHLGRASPRSDAPASRLQLQRSGPCRPWSLGGLGS